MSIIEELQEKLSETRNSVETVLQDLEQYTDVKDSLNDASTGINNASSNLDQLVNSLSSTVTSLNSLADKFDDVIGVVRSSDPAQVLEGQRDTKIKLEEIELSLNAISTNSEETARTVGNLPNSNSVDSSLETLATKISADSESAFDSIKNSIGTVRSGVEKGTKTNSIIIVLVIINVLLTGSLLSNL